MNATSIPIRVLLFDLGGVLVEFDALGPICTLTGNRFDRVSARAFWMNSSAVKQYERGLCSSEEFAVLIMKELDITMTVPAFLKEFASWESGVIPGGKALLAELRPHYRLACLSNNNAIHWDIVGRRDGWQAEFEQTFLSFEMKCMKPERVIFDQVLAKLGCQPNEVFFFDDTAECLEGALAAGIRGAQVAGVEGVRSVVRHLGLLSPN